MEESIRGFAEQFNFEPVIENEDKLKPAKSFVVGGMGGSNLATDIIKSAFPEIDVTVHRNYGLPDIIGEKEEKLFIASSFSGNTEEIINFLNKALEEKLNVAVIAKGGELISIAKGKNLPYIQFPDWKIQPRMALGLSLLGLLKFMKPEIVSELKKLSHSLNPLRFEDEGEELAEHIKGKIPLIYSSEKNKAAARIWKIKFNETAKIPSFFNVLPELNHNEMTGFDYNENNSELSKAFQFIFIKDKNDHERIQKRMEVLGKILKEKSLPVKELEMEGESETERIFNSLLLADWTALYTAKAYDSEPEEVPMVENFKKQLVN